MEDGVAGQGDLLCPEGQVATRLSTGRKQYRRVRYGGASTANPSSGALQVGHLEQGGGTVLAVSR